MRYSYQQRGFAGVIAVVCVVALAKALNDSSPGGCRSGGSTGSSTSKRVDDSAQIRTTPLQWGLYQILWSRRYGDHIAGEAKKFASKPHYLMFYRDLGRPFPRSSVEAVAALGATPMVSLELWSWHGGRKGSYLDALNAGEYDAFIEQWAQDAKAYKRRIMLRFGFEFNGDWFTWSLDPPKFVAAWRRAHAIFNRVGADNVEWVWCPNIVSVPNRAGNAMHLYYPGAKFVDWVSVDGYNFGDHHDQWHKWESFETIFAALLDDFQRRYPDKPMIISEMGAAPGEGNQRPEWIRAAFDTLKRYPQVKAVIWFNYDKRREGEPNWRIDVTPESLAAFNETFARP